MTTLAQLARSLKNHFDSSELTQDALSKEAGISRQTANKALSGNADFKVTTLLAIADRLGLDVILIPKGASIGLAHANRTRTEPLIKSFVQETLEKLHGRGPRER